MYCSLRQIISPTSELARQSVWCVQQYHIPATATITISPENSLAWPLPGWCDGSLGDGLHGGDVRRELVLEHHVVLGRQTSRVRVRVRVGLGRQTSRVRVRVRVS